MIALDADSNTKKVVKNQLRSDYLIFTGDSQDVDYPPAPNLFYYERLFRGRPLPECTLVYQSGNGSPKTVEALACSPAVVICSFLNIRAVAEHILRKNPRTVNILACGNDGFKAIEDEVCARYLKYLLLGGKDDPSLYRKLIMRMMKGKHNGDFFPNALEGPSIEILGFCLRRNLVDVVPVAIKGNSKWCLISKAT